MTRLIIFSLAFIYLGCANTNRQNRVINQNPSRGLIETGSSADRQETRLGQSNYFILLPGTFYLSEARGKEGQLGYNIIPKDKKSTMFGFIEIKHGRPIGGGLVHDGPPKETILSYFLDKQVRWKIYITETGYFDAFTDEEGDLHAIASSKKRNEIDSLISIISTLKQK